MGAEEIRAKVKYELFDEELNYYCQVCGDDLTGKPAVQTMTEGRNNGLGGRVLCSGYSKSNRHCGGKRIGQVMQNISQPTLYFQRLEPEEVVQRIVEGDIRKFNSIDDKVRE